MPTVMLADDHVTFTDAIARLLERRFNIVGTVADGSQVVEAASRLKPDIIVLDISMPKLSGLEALRRLKANHVVSRVIVLTMHADVKLATGALQVGAKGFVLKQSSSHELVDAIDAALQDRTYLTPALTNDVLAMMAGQADPGDVELSARQKEVLRLIVDGRRMKEIADSLELSPRTVETIKYGIMRRFNVHTTAALVRYALEHRLVVF